MAIYILLPSPEIVRSLYGCSLLLLFLTNILNTLPPNPFEKWMSRATAFLLFAAGNDWFAPAIAALCTGNRARQHSGVKWFRIQGFRVKGLGSKGVPWSHSLLTTCAIQS